MTIDVVPDGAVPKIFPVVLDCASAPVESAVAACSALRSINAMTSIPGKVAVVPATMNAPAAAPARQGAIQLLSGVNVGKELLLTKALTTLGKPGVQVAVITRRPQGYFITHVEGANFPIVNGKTLDAQAHPLNDHDVIEIAGTKMEFFSKSGGRPSASGGRLPGMATDGMGHSYWR